MFYLNSPLLIVNFICFRRKWLPPPLRKLSQGKVDKTSSAAERPLVKKPSDKSFKLPTEKHTEEDFKSLPTSHSANQDLETEEEVAFELPPPMKPIQDSQSASMAMANGPTASSNAAGGSGTSSAVTEQSPCKRVSYFVYLVHY